LIFHRAVYTFDSRQLLSQPPKPGNQRIILHALALLPPQPPPVRSQVASPIRISAGSRLPVTARAWPWGNELYKVGAAAKDGGDGRVRGSSMFLDGGGEGDALGYDKGHGIDGYRHRAAPVLHARGEQGVPARGRWPRCCCDYRVHGRRKESISAHVGPSRVEAFAGTDAVLDGGDFTLAVSAARIEVGSCACTARPCRRDRMDKLSL
jgi:hypothetical protein